MHTFINIIYPDKPNTVEQLDNLSKNKILSYIVASQLQSKQYFVAVACDIHEYIQDLTPASQLVTLNEWLLEKNLDLERAGKHRLAQIVAKKYKEVYHQAPRIIARPDDKKKWQKKAYGFHKDELHILDEALQEFQRTTAVVSTGQPAS